MKIIGANITGSFILNGTDVTNTIQSSNTWSGSVASNINNLNAATASINASISSLNAATSSLNSATSSLNSSITSLNAATASLYTATASLNATITTLTTTASFNSYTSSNDSAVLSASMAAVAAAASAAALTAKTSSYATTSSLNIVTASLNTFTASVATTGSNTFFGTQTITGSLFISQNLVVQGSSSIQNITASAVSIGTNTVILNTDSPAIRFGGIKVQDSGSSDGASGSLLWDSLEDRWLYVTPSGSSEGYNSAILISGPKNSGSVGSEVGLTTNKIAKAVGDDHIGDSIMTETGTTISVAGNLSATSLTGSINGSQLTDATVSNAKLTNSTISGISLGSNLATLTIGTGLSGTSYNGSTGITIANSGVTSIVAGTGISINQGTGAVTVTNTITNNNQLTNGAGYQTTSGTVTNTSYINLTGGQSGAITINEGRTAVYRTEGGSGGTFSYAPLLHVGGGDTMWQIQGSYGGSGTGNIQWRQGYAGSFGGWCTILHNNNVGSYAVPIGGGTMTGQLQINTPSNGVGSAFQLYSTAYHQYLSIYSNGSIEAMVNYRNNDAQWYVGIRTSSQLVGTSGFHFYNTTSAQTVGGFTIGGNFYTIGSIVASGDVTAYSDARVKTNIKPIDSSLEKVLKLTGVTYNRTDVEDKSTKIGFIAQEVKEVLPEVVTYNEEVDKYGVSYGNVTALLVEAIKEQQTQIEELKTIINALTK